MVKTRKTIKQELLEKKKLDFEEPEEVNKMKNMKSSEKVLEKTLSEQCPKAVKNTLEKSHHSLPASLQNSSSSSSSIRLQRKRLELEAAQAKARIQMELIDKKLEADLANLEENYSPTNSRRSKSSRASDLLSRKSEIERWVEQGKKELEAQQVTKLGNKDLECAPPDGKIASGTDGPVQQLTTALRDLVTTVSSNPNSNLLSRLSTPRELPVFAGDPMEWLSFKQAYEESTEVCHFSAKENLWRLRKCLRGPAREAVSSLLISATGPENIMSTLELQFGNPEIILSKIALEIKRLHPLPVEYQRDIISFSIKIKNYVAAVQALGCDEYLEGMNMASIVLSKLPSVLLSKWTDYSYPLISTGKKSRLLILSEFLSEEANKIAKCSVSSLYPRSDHYKRKHFETNLNVQETVLVNTEVAESEKCRFCRLSKHKLIDCKKFKKALRKDRWFYVKRYGICYKCLVSHHDRQICPAPSCDVNECGQSHHRLLHYSPSDPKKKSVAESETQTETVTNINNSTCAVLLKVVPVNIHGPNGVISATALLDDGSTVSMISSALAAEVGIRGRREVLRVCGAWNNTELVCDAEIVQLNISNKDGTIFNINLRSVNDFNLPKQDLTSVNCDNYEHLSEIKSYLCVGKLKPQILIGQDNYHLLLPKKTLVGKINEPCATLTPLGWCIHGRVRTSSPQQTNSTLFICNTSKSEDILQEIHEEVRQSFSLESMGVSGLKRLNSEDVRAQEHLEKTSYLAEGRWYVGLPWKSKNCTLPDSYPNALKRLEGVERKMKKNTEYAERYKERICHLLTNDYAEELTDTKVTPKTWYLPHFGVDNPNKKKLRLVFDAASQVEGVSLNDYLLKGPDLLMSLFGIMLRFRENKIAVMGDIRDMFLRIKIREEDRNAFRFLFRDSEIGTPSSDQNHSKTPAENMKNPETNTYIMSSLIFGANCSPFIAQFIKNKNAKRFESSMPMAVEAICTQHYMDDYIQSVPDEKTAIQLVQDVTYIHRQGGFEIRNWTSNSQEVLNTLPKESICDTSIKFKIDQNYEGERTLGLIWHPHEDSLGLDISLKKIPEHVININLNRKPTKREILKVIMSIFDVYGFLSPCTINGKIILQDTWRSNIKWDDPLPDEIFLKWSKWIKMLQELRNIRLPRYYAEATECSNETKANPVITISESSMCAPAARCTFSYTNLELHIFCDASSKAMCAVAYWRWKENKNIYVAFIASRCRVAPIKQTSMPRLELQAALLAARLADTIIKEHKISPQQRYYWSDSSTVLYWIKNTAKNYKSFVAHRLGEIDDLSNIRDWRYVPTKLNVADIATRENYDVSALKNEWMYGPKFLQCEESEWPSDILHSEVKTTDLECLNTIQIVNENLPVPEPTRFSSWLRLVRATAMIYKFIEKCKKSTTNSSESTMEKATKLLLKYSQQETFLEEISLIKSGKYLPKTSRILTLSPYLDDDGILRAGGRIDAAAAISPETKRPVILDGKNYITRLIVRSYHINAAHANQETIVNNLKQKYWILKLRPTIKNVVSKCMFCRIRKCQPEVPRIGNLPEARLAHHRRPFTFCGVDLFGPMDVTVGRRHEKRYGVLFTCLTVRAIHIEIVNSLTCDSFIMALRRMASRRGWPQHMFSDNGTNLKGADTELKKSIEELDENVLKDEASNHGTEWTFIPPASPHWGGAWERLIRSVKTSLKTILKERVPKEETLITLLAEVENMVNSRPLNHVSVEPGSCESLTPNHFLLGSSSTLPQLGKFDDSDLYLRKQWRTSQRLADMYWQRWTKEILPDMIPRRKWPEERPSLQVGDLVVLIEPNGIRGIWPKGIIHEVYPDRDGRVRVVKVKIGNDKFLTRSVGRVARLAVCNECC